MTSRVNNIGYLVSMQRSSGETFGAIGPLDMNHPPKHCCRSSTPPHSNLTPQRRSSPTGTFRSDTPQKLLRNVWRNMTKGCGVDLAYKFPQIPTGSSICGTCWIESDLRWLLFTPDRICHQCPVSIPQSVRAKSDKLWSNHGSEP